MTFVDTSAIVAILLREPESRELTARALSDGPRITSPAVRLETCMVIASRRDVSPERAQDYFESLASQMELSEVPIDERVGRLAVECFGRYGKGRHPAGLNFGDCLSYASAKAHRAKLLFKGNDFAKSDANSWIR